VWVSTTGFYNRINGLITQQAAEGDSLIFQNAQNLTSRGLELEVRTRLPQRFQATGSYSFQQSTDAITRSVLDNSPRSLAKIGITQPLLEQRMFVTLDARFQSRVKAIDGSKVSPFSVVDLTILGRRIGKHTSISGSIYNVFDKKYFDVGSGANIQPAIQQDGRTARIKVTWKFGE
jgi:iron complex outermembrane receptor protein